MLDGGVDPLESTRRDDPTPTQAPRSHTRIARFEIVGGLGTGGMGVVVEARDAQLGRTIALKLLRTSSPRARELLVREARAMAKVSDPNVVTVFDAGEHGDEVWIAMELCTGGSLRAWLREPRPWRAIVERFVAAGRGLAAAHAAGLVHRDFKPDNVLLDGHGGVRVGDFGLARPGEAARTHRAALASRDRAARARTGSRSSADAPRPRLAGARRENPRAFRLAFSMTRDAADGRRFPDDVEGANGWAG